VRRVGEKGGAGRSGGKKKRMMGGGGIWKEDLTGKKAFPLGLEKAAGEKIHERGQAGSQSAGQRGPRGERACGRVSGGVPDTINRLGEWMDANRRKWKSNGV